MPEHTEVTFTTERGNPPPLVIQCTCDDLWSVAQQRAMEELYPRLNPCEPKVCELGRPIQRFIPVPTPLPAPALGAPLPEVAGKEALHPNRLEDYRWGAAVYGLHARLIARAYACMFLEDFEHGKPEKMGRFYWAGLAAFASKQVACTVSNLVVQHFVPDTLHALGKGNLWLFNDAWPWHYAWAVCPASVDKCASKRDTRNLHPTVLQNFIEQEWAEEVAPNVPWHIDENTGAVGKSIGHLRLAPLMAKAIEGWRHIDAEQNTAMRRNQCMGHLWAMARHEQGEVLQGLIYSEPGFQEDLKRGRLARDDLGLDKQVLLFKLQLSFSAQEYVKDAHLRSDAPTGICLESYKERMEWIRATAGQYHSLMSGSCRERMLGELRALAAYYD